MLFIQSNSLALSTTGGERLRLLDALAEKGFTPLIRSTRVRLFRSLVARRGGGDAAVADAAAELEREGAARRQESDEQVAYTPGELFCADDCALYLIFRGTDEGVCAGIIYSVDTAGPLARLDRFCRDVRHALGEIKKEAKDAPGEVRQQASGEIDETEQDASGEIKSGEVKKVDDGPAATGPTPELPGWQTRGGKLSQGLARFIAIQPADFIRAAAAHRGGRELTRASELMQEPPVRLFLRRVQEMRREGYTPRRLFKEAGALGVAAVERMLEAGLLEREVRVSCRKSGHALFDLPSPDSLAAITISKAKCSLCAAPVADEVVEETINPTRLAVALLEDGRWLTNRVYKLVRSLGIPDSEIATGPASAHGESYLAVDVCGNSFLFVTRDGDLTPAFSRRVVETVEETEATHLVVVVTGKVEEEGRMRLYEFAWRRARDGQDLGTTLVEGLGAAREQMEHAFERVVQRELSHNLFALDSALGFGAGDFVLNWFKSVKARGAEKHAADTAAQSFIDLDRQVAS